MACGFRNANIQTARTMCDSLKHRSDQCWTSAPTGRSLSLHSSAPVSALPTQRWPLLPRSPALRSGRSRGCCSGNAAVTLV